jgi:hypothetical protein
MKLSESDLQLGYRMRAAAVPIDAGEFKSPLIVTQLEGPMQNFASSDYVCGDHLGLIAGVLLKIVCDNTTPFTLCGMTLVLPWKDSPLNLLQDPMEDGAPQTYRFPGDCVDQYDKSDVLPRSHKTLHRGGTIEGWVFGYDFDPIPKCFRQGTIIHAVLRIFDQFDMSHAEEVKLWIHRQRELYPKPVRRRRRPLFDRPDLLSQSEVPAAEEDTVLVNSASPKK